MRTAFFWAMVVGLVGLATGCAHRGPARVTAVSITTWDQTVQETDQRLFLASRATGSRFRAQVLPPEERFQEVHVSWAGTAVDAVVLEYRQPQAASPIQHQTHSVINKYCHTFRIGSDALRAGGPLSAWRVTLFAGGHPVAQKQSALWQ